MAYTFKALSLMYNVDSLIPNILAASLFPSREWPVLLKQEENETLYIRMENCYSYKWRTYDGRCYLKYKGVNINGEIIIMLAAKEASYITGESLIVDGGNSIQEYKGPSEHYY